MKRDVDYVIKDGEIIIVDEFTGRLMFGRRYSEGLHQAIEAKEHLSVQRESKTLAQRFGGEVVSVDSMQIYRGMTFGPAAPTAEEMEGVPHHMVAVADPAESWSVARYVREADACVQDILRRGKRPVLVGGTGLYLDALVRGQDFAAGSQGGEIRRELQEKLAKDGAEALLEALRAVDPESAARLHLRDEKRIVRALEV